jgi:hypothetical protein
MRAPGDYDQREGGSQFFFSRIQRAVPGQIEFASHARVGRVGEGIFAVGGVLGLAAARGQGGQVLFGGCEFRRPAGADPEPESG